MSRDNTSIADNYTRIKEEALKHSSEKDKSSLPVFYIGMSTCCRAAGSVETKEALEATLNERGIKADIVSVGCTGHCYAEPTIIVNNPDSGFPPILYYNVTPGKARLLVKSFLEKGDPLFEYVLGAMENNDMIPTIMEFPRFNLEKRVVMENCGSIDPGNINRYIEKGGYSSLAKALEMSPDEVINEVRLSGLRGRGGAGFPAARKWELVKNAPGENKTVICNADEGDPGAYMDRTIIESNPHQLLEGIIICAYAVGASEAIVYVRSEYPLAVQMIKDAIQEAGKKGLVGGSILGSGFSLDISVFTGSGAFVCGEETALIKSIEGKRGMPNHRPPYPALSGLWGNPTNINNVKTLASIPYIIKNGGSHYSGIGVAGSPGTAIFSVVGNVVHAGLVEIPMGVTIGSLIFEVCGGIPNKKKFKAIQIGGPSGGCLPEGFLETPIDFDSLIKAGAMMGSGGIVVMDEDSCMVDVAKYFLEFTQDESCGKCTFCRIGTKHLLNILTRLTKGEGQEGDLEKLESLAADIKSGSLCGLGKTSPNPVLTSLKYFKEEYEAHLNEKRCPALKCRALIAYYIDLDQCARGCEACVGSCPTEAIFTAKGRKKAIDQTLCVKCGECMVACPAEYHAVKKVSPPELAPVIERPKEEADGKA